MSKLIPIGLGITLTFGMALDSPGAGANIATFMCALGLIVVISGQAIDCCNKRTHRSCNFYKFK